MSRIGGQDPGRIAAEAARRAAEARLQAEAARAAALAEAVRAALDPSHPSGADDLGRVLHEARALSSEAKRVFLAAVVERRPSEGSRDPGSILRERVDASFPPGTEKRKQLAEALIRAGGSSASGVSPRALEIVLDQALAALAAPPARPALSAARDVMERASGPGIFGKVVTPASGVPQSGPDVIEASVETVTAAAPQRPPPPSAAAIEKRQEEGRSWAEAPIRRQPGDAAFDKARLSQVFGGGLAASADTAVAAARGGRLEPGLSARALKVKHLGWAEAAPGVVGKKLGAVLAQLAQMDQTTAQAHEVLAWLRPDRVRVAWAAQEAARRLDGVAFHADRARELLARELRPMGSAAFRRDALAARKELAAVRQETAGASEVLSEGGPALRTAQGLVQEIDLSALRAEGELRTALGQAELLGEIDAGEGAFVERGPAPEPLAPDEAAPEGAGVLTEEDLSRIGSALDPSKPPAQTLWNEELVNVVSDLGRKQGGLSEEQGGRNGELARSVLDPEGKANPNGPPQELGAADLAAVLKLSGLDLERLDPNQLQAASRYLNTATTLADQQEKLRKTIDNFQVLQKIGLPKLPRDLMGAHLWAVARVPAHAIAKLSDGELQKKFQEVMGAVNGGPGQYQVKLGKHNLKFTVGESGQVTQSSCKKPGLFSKIGGVLKKIAPLAMTALSFWPPAAPFVRMGQAVISGVRAIKRKSLLGIATAAANFVAGGATKLAGKGAQAAGSVFTRVATIADSAARALHGYSALRRGSLLSGLANIAGGIAGGVKGMAGKVSARLLSVASHLDRIADGMLKAAAGLDAVSSYSRARRALDEARKALALAERQGNPAEIARARQAVEAAEREKRAALLGGLGSVGMVGADLVGRRKTPGAGEQVDRQPAFGAEAALRAASRGFSTAGSVARRDWEAAGANAVGLAAAIQTGLPTKPQDPNDPVARRLDQILGPGPRVSWLNDASNVADAGLGYRQAERGLSGADRAVDEAERMLRAARALGDPEAVREAEASLARVRRERDAALMGVIASGDSMVRTPVGIAEQHRQAETFKEARRQALRVARDYQELAAQAAAIANRAGPGTEAGEKAAAEWHRLRQARDAFERALSENRGNPEALRAATAAFRADQVAAAWRLLGLEELAPAIRYADGPGGVSAGGYLRPAALAVLEGPRDIRAEAKRQLAAHRKLLEAVGTHAASQALESGLARCSRSLI